MKLNRTKLVTFFSSRAVRGNSSLKNERLSVQRRQKCIPCLRQKELNTESTILLMDDFPLTF